MDTDDTEAIGDEYVQRGFVFPLNEQQLVELKPVLNRLAVQYATCKSDREDYVQQAYMALIDGRRVWTNPVTAAQSAMIDYKRSSWRIKNSVRFEASEDGLNDPSYLMPDTLSSDEGYERLKRFEGLGLTDTERQAAILYWVEELSQTEVGDRLGIPQTTLSTLLKHVRDAVWVREYGEDQQ